MTQGLTSCIGGRKRKRTKNLQLEFFSCSFPEFPLGEFFFFLFGMGAVNKVLFLKLAKDLSKFFPSTLKSPIMYNASYSDMNASFTLLP